MIWIFAFILLLLPCKIFADSQNSINTTQTLTMPDSRILSVASFLDGFKCSDKITDFNTATTFVALADKNNIDWRYEVIFFFKESTCGQHMKFYNPFGLMKRGGESAGLQHFNSLDEAFEAEASYLATPLYKGKTISQITHIYCPPREGEPYTYYSDFLNYYNQITNWQTTYEQISTGTISR